MSPHVLQGIRGISRDVLDFFFPPLCLSCGEKLLPGEGFFCSRCHGAFESLPLPLCPVCGAPLGNKSLEKNRCPKCPTGVIYFDAAHAPLLYHGPVVDGILALKFHSRLELAAFFARILLYYIKMEMKTPDFEGIVPVPLHYRRFYKRGYNQSEEIGRELSRYLDLPLWPEAVRRSRRTSPQTRLSTHADRKKNVRRAFQPAFPEPVKDRHVLLLDDVYTTGSTLNECSRVLKDVGARKVTALTVCRALSID